MHRIYSIQGDTLTKPEVATFENQTILLFRGLHLNWRSVEVTLALNPGRLKYIHSFKQSGIEARWLHFDLCLGRDVTTIVNAAIATFRGKKIA